MNLEELAKRLEDTEKANAELSNQNAALKKKAALVDPQWAAAYDAMTGEEQAEFDALDQAGKTEKMKAKGVCKAAPAEIEKLDEVTKALDEAKGLIAKRDEIIGKQADEIETLKLSAEVEKTYPNAKGTTEEKVRTLKAIKAITDESVKKTLLDSFAASEELAKNLCVEKGAGSGGDATGTPESKLQKMAEEKAKTDNIPFAKAYGEVLKTDEGKSLYNASQKAGQ